MNQHFSALRPRFPNEVGGDREGVDDRPIVTAILDLHVEVFEIIWMKAIHVVGDIEHVRDTETLQECQVGGIGHVSEVKVLE
eukprot:CAMPEP_0115305788 /NCGR_PEP_ID=MMETSP0270-20121206/72221_1 /TAXON_ID=71861 /ORGANISM="Scrippsiella trochoidea, Strain CCMP3099" /LENGTH=81 /DNA_ID=CAMNT_0002724041 /DNA_START=277 /DNA_END=522 /DNA_ORIENTATION=-